MIFLTSIWMAALTSCSLSNSSNDTGSQNPENSTPSDTTPTAAHTPTTPYPEFRGQDFHGEKNFALLMNKYTQGKSLPTPWAGYWWPYTKNGIAAGEFGGLTATTPLGLSQWSSPAGKYDAARGNITHAQEWEVRLHGARVPKVQQWWGHCNGWCAAAALFPEPHEAVTVNGITFGIADIKGLLTEAGMSVNADFFGERVDVDDINSPKYWDIVPDQYFLVLTNYIGKLKQAVLIDRYTGSQIWNQPLAGYSFEYPTPNDYLGNSVEAPHIYRMLVTSTIWWLDDGVSPDVQTHAFNFEAEDPTGVVQSRTLKMEVWLDGPVVFDSSGKIASSGDIVVTRQGEFASGGAWRMGDGYYVDAWPDYMWIPYALVKPTDPEQDYVNPEIDFSWLKTHILVPGGADDLTVDPGNILPAPVASGTVPWPVTPGSPWPGTSPSGSTSPFPWPGFVTDPGHPRPH